MFGEELRKELESLFPESLIWLSHVPVYFRFGNVVFDLSNEDE